MNIIYLLIMLIFVIVMYIYFHYIIKFITKLKFLFFPILWLNKKYDSFIDFVFNHFKPIPLDPSIQQKADEILDKLDIKNIEVYLRKKKLNKIK